jgi:transposase
MSTRELTRAGVLARVAAGTLRLGSAAALMDVSYRQAKRLYRRYRAEGACGLQHRSAGRRSNAARDGTERVRILALVREKYSGPIDQRFGPTLAAEHLAAEDGVHVHHDTLRRWMLAAGLWSRARKRSPHRRLGDVECPHPLYGKSSWEPSFMMRSYSSPRMSRM